MYRVGWSGWGESGMKIGWLWSRDTWRTPNCSKRKTVMRECKGVVIKGSLRLNEIVNRRSNSFLPSKRENIEGQKTVKTKNWFSTDVEGQIDADFDPLLMLTVDQCSRLTADSNCKQCFPCKLQFQRFNLGKCQGVELISQRWTLIFSSMKRGFLYNTKLSIFLTTFHGFQSNNTRSQWCQAAALCFSNV